MYHSRLRRSVGEPHRLAVVGANAARCNHLTPLLEVAALVTLVKKLKERRHGEEHPGGVDSEGFREGFLVPAEYKVAILSDRRVGG